MSAFSQSPDKRPDKESHAVKRFYEAMDKSAADSLSEEQKNAIDEAVIISILARKHSIDIRSVIPFFRTKYYFVLLFGKDYRRQEYKPSFIMLLMMSILIVSLFFALMIGLFLILYLLKSALGIDLFSGFSLGIWDLFKEKFI